MHAMDEEEPEATPQNVVGIATPIQNVRHRVSTLQSLPRKNTKDVSLSSTAFKRRSHLGFSSSKKRRRSISINSIQSNDIFENDNNVQSYKKRRILGVSSHRSNKSMQRTPWRSELTNQQLSTLYHECLKLKVENKINRKNSWDLSLIDHIGAIVRRFEKSNDLNDADKLNFDTIKKNGIKSKRNKRGQNNKKKAGKKKSNENENENGNYSDGNSDKENIDYFDSSRNGEKQNGVNFTKASAALDVAARIYSCRVDSIHDETYRVLGRIGDFNPNKNDGNSNIIDNDSDANEQENQSGDNSNVDVAIDGENDGNMLLQWSDEAMDQMDGKKKRKEFDLHKYVLQYKEKSNHVSKNNENLSFKKSEQLMSTNPLFHKMTTLFDMQGAKGLLMHNLQCSIDDGYLMLDGNIPYLGTCLNNPCVHELQSQKEKSNIEEATQKLWKEVGKSTLGKELNEMKLFRGAKYFATNAVSNETEKGNAIENSKDGNNESGNEMGYENENSNENENENDNEIETPYGGLNMKSDEIENNEIFGQFSMNDFFTPRRGLINGDRSKFSPRVHDTLMDSLERNEIGILVTPERGGGEGGEESDNENGISLIARLTQEHLDMLPDESNLAMLPQLNDIDDIIINIDNNDNADNADNQDKDSNDSMGSVSASHDSEHGNEHGNEHGKDNEKENEAIGKTNDNKNGNKKTVSHNDGLIDFLNLNFNESDKKDLMIGKDSNDEEDDDDNENNMNLNDYCQKYNCCRKCVMGNIDSSKLGNKGYHMLPRFLESEYRPNFFNESFFNSKNYFLSNVLKPKRMFNLTEMQIERYCNQETHFQMTSDYINQAKASSQLNRMMEEFGDYMDDEIDANIDNMDNIDDIENIYDNNGNNEENDNDMDMGNMGNMGNMDIMDDMANDGFMNDEPLFADKAQSPLVDMHESNSLALEKASASDSPFSFRLLSKLERQKKKNKRGVVNIRALKETMHDMLVNCHENNTMSFQLLCDQLIDCDNLRQNTKKLLTIPNLFITLLHLCNQYNFHLSRMHNDDANLADFFISPSEQQLNISKD